MASNKCRLRSAIDICAIHYAESCFKTLNNFFSMEPNKTIFCFLGVRQNGLKMGSNFTDAVL